MALTRSQGAVVVLERGVYFPMMDRSRRTRITAIHTRAGFRKLFGTSELTQQEQHLLFTAHREQIEKLASNVYEA